MFIFFASLAGVCKRGEGIPVAARRSAVPLRLCAALPWHVLSCLGSSCQGPAEQHHWHLQAVSALKSVSVVESACTWWINSDYRFSAKEPESRINVKGRFGLLGREITTASTVVSSIAAVGIYFVHVTNSGGCLWEGPAIAILFHIFERYSGNGVKFPLATACGKIINRFWVPNLFI